VTGVQDSAGPGKLESVGTEAVPVQQEKGQWKTLWRLGWEMSLHRLSQWTLMS
jgi:hypothetical protein